jgi:DNA polymerase III sliding clamp (beta) subunit (PCNA family)
VVTVDGATLGNAIDAVAYAISPDETRAHVNSMLLEWQGPTLRLVATDGHRLSRYETTCDASGKGSVLVPLASVGELRKLCDVDSIALRISGTSLVVESGGLPDAAGGCILPTLETGGPLASHHRPCAAHRAA